MSRKEFVKLMEENVLIVDRLADKLRLPPDRLSGYPRNLLNVLVRLHIGGGARLKDIARREGVSTPNLCAAFRRLERDGLVLRVADDMDRRNVHYSVTDAGRELALRVIDNFRYSIDKMFSNLSHDDEVAMTGAMKTINKILKKME